MNGLVNTFILFYTQPYACMKMRFNSLHNFSELLKKLDNEMNSYNISFHDLINKSYFKNDQRENVLKVIRVLMPSFEPLYTKLDTTYKCKLLHEIPMNRNYESPTNGLLTLEKLKDLAKLQIEAESKIEVEIPSIEASDKDIISIAKSVRYCVIFHCLILNLFEIIYLLIYYYNIIV